MTSFCRSSQHLLQLFAAFILLFSPLLAYSQNADEAKKVEERLASESDPRKKMALYLNTLDEIGDFDSVATERYTAAAYILADKLKDKNSKMEIYRQHALMYLSFNNVPKAMPLFHKALELAIGLNDRIKAGDIYNNISNAYGQVQNNKLADEFILKALKEYQAENSEADVAMVYANMGSNYSRRGEYSLAIDYLLKSLTIRERLKNDKGVGSVAFNITLPYKFLKRYDEAIKYNQLAIEKLTLVKNEGLLASAYAVKGSLFRALKKYDDALIFINKALPLFEKYKNTAGIRNCYDNIGLLYAAKKDFNAALKYFLMSKQLSVAANDPRGIVSADVNIAQTALDLNDLPKLASTLNEAEPIAKKYAFKEDLAELYKLKHDHAIAINDRSGAGQSLEDYLRLKDSLNSSEVNKQISELQTRYQTEKKDNQISLLNNEKQINLLLLKNQDLAIQQKQTQLIQKERDLLINKLEVDNQRHTNEQQTQHIKTLQKQSRIQELELSNKALQLRQRNLLIAGFCILLTAAAVMAYAYYNRYKLQQEARLQAALHKQQEIETRSLFEGEQNERIRIARDLHDSIGQMLSVVKMNLSNAPKTASTDITLDLVDHTIAEVRNISHNLIPEELNFGLFTALEDMCEKLNNGNTTRVKINIPGELREHQFEKTNELSIYRIVQEVLSNMVKHAQASQIELGASSHGDGFTIIIKDNGKGFDTSHLNRSKGLGWKNIAARVNMLDGKIQVRSEQLAGTQIEIMIPKA